MQVVLNQSLGYVDCNVCGSGYNKVRIEFDGDTFNYIRTSNCYGTVDRRKLNQTEMLELLDRDHFLVSTRPSRRAVRDFKLSVKRGDIQPASQEVDDYSYPAEDRCDDPNCSCNQGIVMVDEPAPEPVPAAQVSLYEWQMNLLDDYRINLSAPLASELNIIRDTGSVF